MATGRTFEFLSELAEGSFGKVYLARMNSGEAFSSVVAVKLLHGPWAQNKEVLARVRDEARLLGHLRHRNIVRVDDLTVINGQCAIVMEYLEGADMRRVVNALVKNRQRMPPRAGFQVVGQVSRALDAAWGFVPIGATEPLRLIHRDVKPSNVMLTADSVVKLLDFGTARAEFDARETETRSMTFGSRPYMSPERILSDALDTPAVDVYALGVSLYEILRGRQFGKAPLERQAFENHVDSRLERMSPKAFGDHAQSVTGLIREMVHWEPTRRPSAGQVAERLAALGRAIGGMELEEFSSAVVPHIKQVDAPAKPPPSLDAFSLVGQVLPESEDMGTLAFSRTLGAPTSPLPGAPVLPSPPSASAPLPISFTGTGAVQKPLVPGWLRTIGLAGLVVLLAFAGAKLLRALEEPKGFLDGIELRSEAPVEVITIEETKALEPEAESNASVVETSSEAANTNPQAPNNSAATEETSTNETTRSASHQTASSTPPEQPPAPPTEAMASVSLAGGAEQVQLVSSAGTWTLPASVPAGSYKIIAIFPGQSPMGAGSLTLKPGQQQSLNCDAVFTRCR